MRKFHFPFLRVNYLLLFSALSVCIVIGSLWYSNTLVRRIAQKEERLVGFWSDAFKFMMANDNCESQFLFNRLAIEKPIDIPAIVTDRDGNPVQTNLPYDSTMTSEQYQIFILKELENMKSSGFQPIPVEYVPGSFLYVYYRETDELIQLRFYPYITFLLIAIFIVIIFINFNIAQRSQQNKVWAGLAKETAHQLGTPISGLIAWVELLRLRSQTEEDEMVVNELEKDINHLQIIADRFSKIGSEPDLVDYPVRQILENSLNYVRSRVSKRKVSIELREELPPNLHVRISPPLFEWVIENLLKNAIDALTNRNDGQIIIFAEVRGDYLVIDVSDNGKGITRTDLKNIFKPGFTTKKRGWGLGLSLSRRIIERFHKGKIFVKRTEPDKGTTFRILIPAPKAPNLRN